MISLATVTDCSRIFVILQTFSWQFLLMIDEQQQSTIDNCSQIGWHIWFIFYPHSQPAMHALWKVVISISSKELQAVQFHIITSLDPSIYSMYGTDYHSTLFQPVIPVYIKSSQKVFLFIQWMQCTLNIQMHLHELYMLLIVCSTANEVLWVRDR